MFLKRLSCKKKKNNNSTKKLTYIFVSHLPCQKNPFISLNVIFLKSRVMSLVFSCLPFPVGFSNLHVS